MGVMSGDQCQHLQVFARGDQLQGEPGSLVVRSPQQPVHLLQEGPGGRR